jgi:tryptophan synthase alpha chain
VNTLKEAFTKAKSENRLALIGYLPINYPDSRSFLILARSSFEAGLDMLEIGLPTKKAIFDGKVIRTALELTASKGTETREALIIGGKAFSGGGNAGIVMTYAKTMKEYGPEKLIEHCSVLGINGVLAVGLDNNEWKKYAQIAKDYHINMIGFIPPDIQNEQIEELSRYASGFLYLQSQKGPTGQRVDNELKLCERIAEIRQLTLCSSLPIVIGFGIQEQKDVIKIANSGADGVVIGTALTKAANNGRKEVKSLINSLKAGTAFPLRSLK